jgi:hypothetical protein
VRLHTTTGDNAYESGTFDQYNNCYGPNWGEFEAITRPSPGNHEYQTVGAAGYCGLDVKASGGHGVTPLFIGPNVECTHFIGPPPPK